MALHDLFKFTQQAFVGLCIEDLERCLNFCLVREFLRHENVRERGVHGVVHPGQSFNGFRARQCLRRQKMCVRKFLVKVQNDGQDLGHHLPVIDQHGHLSAGVDGFVVVTVLLALVQLDHLRLVVGARQLQQAVRDERTGAGCKIKFQAHGFFLVMITLSGWICCNVRSGSRALSGSKPQASKMPCRQL